MRIWGPVFFVCLLVVWSVHAQTPARADAAATAPTSIKLDYPDSPSGLERLAKDILKAQKENDSALADLLLKSMVLPNAYDWYQHIWGDFAADQVGDYYEKAAASLPPSLARSFLNITRDNFTEVRAAKFENSCDDNAADDVYGLLLRRAEAVPLYELRFTNGQKFVRLSPIVYVDGGFRFVLSPDYQPPTPESKDAADAPKRNPTDPNAHPPEPRLRVGGAVQAARLVNRVQPIYPPRAREERLQGTVRLHAIIAKSGEIRQITEVHGSCSLAESAVAAVRKWRYQPTLFNGSPVEVDTEIDVIFSLRQ